MSCEICGRSSCTRSFHSLEAQMEFDEKKLHSVLEDTTDIISAAIDEQDRLRRINADLLKALERIADLPNKSSLHTEDDLAVLIAKQAVAGIRHATG